LSRNCYGRSRCNGAFLKKIENNKSVDDHFIHIRIETRNFGKLTAILSGGIIVAIVRLKRSKSLDRLIGNKEGSGLANK
jgi:hypothetical protein